MATDLAFSVHAYDVEANRPFEHSRPQEKIEGDAHQALLLGPPDGLQGIVLARTPLHLDKDEHRPVGSHNVYLAAPGPVVTPDDLHAGPGQVLDRGLFGGASELYVLRPPTHAPWHGGPVPFNARHDMSGGPGPAGARFFPSNGRVSSPIVRISKEEVAKVARLARLELDANEIDSLAADLDSILGYVAKLDELDTADIVPTSQVVADQPPLRTDEVTNRPCPEDAVANAPETEDGMFVVPSIIE